MIYFLTDLYTNIIDFNNCRIWRIRFKDSENKKNSIIKKIILK
nr:MAG TPA_asm: hypothetical protein [Caudoviricetes sp.]